MFKRWMGWIQPIVLGLAIIFVIVLLAGQWGKLAAYPWRLDVRWLGLSAVMVVVSWGIEIGLWKRILGLVANDLGHTCADPSRSENTGHKNTKEQKYRKVLPRRREDAKGREEAGHKNTEEQKHKKGIGESRITHHESRITNHVPAPSPQPLTSLPFFTAARIWFLSAITRYIPGNIWQPLSLTVYCRRLGFAPEATLTSVVLYQVMLLLSAIPIAGIYFFVTGNFGVLSEYVNGVAIWLLPLGLVPLGIFLARPDWLMLCLNWGLRKVGRDPLSARLGWRDLLGLILIATLHWIAWGICFAALVFALTEYGWAERMQFAPHLVAVYAIAYTIGYLSFITPSGIGVREGAFFVLLAPLIGGSVVAVVAVGMRLWTTLGELSAAGISAGFDIWLRRGDRQKDLTNVATEPSVSFEQKVDRA